jgi:hypothetical protein
MTDGPVAGPQISRQRYNTQALAGEVRPCVRHRDVTGRRSLHDITAEATPALQKRREQSIRNTVTYQQV